MSKNVPTNKKLYARVKAEAKRKFDRWPSAYGSAWLVREYKKRGGGYRKAEMGMEVDNPYADMYSVGGGIMTGDYEMGYGGMPEYGYGGQEYSEGGMPEYKNGGGIPQRYRNMGFTKVGAKKKSTRPGKKWMVLAKKGDKYKVVHGGDSNMKDFKQHGSAKRKKRFWDRMGGRNSAKAKDPFSPLYWHKRFGTWAEGGEMEFEPHMMYDPETGKGFMAEKYEDHVKMDKMGFTHDTPEMGYGGYKYGYGGKKHGTWQKGGELNDPSMDRTITPERQAEMDQIAADDFAASPSGYRTITPERQFLDDYVSYTDSIGFPISKEEYSKRTGITPDMYRTITPERQAKDVRNYKKGGINNPGFRALPPEVQDKIRANMKMGGDMYRMGGMPCYECGGTMKYGGTPKYQFAGTAGMNPFTQEEEEYMQQTYGTPADPTASMELPTLDLSPLENMVYEDVPEEMDNFEFIPGRSDNMRTTKNWMMQTPDGKLPTFTHKSGKKFNLDKAFETVDALSGLAGMAGRNAKRSRQLQQNKQRQFTDNLYDPIRAGEIGSRGDYNISGQFRPDRVANWNPYMAESFNTTPFYQEGGVTEMTDAEIERLRAMGADIEILD